MTLEKLATYAGLLMPEFRADAFTPESLQTVSEGCEFFPAYSVLRTGLLGYLANRRQIAAPSDTSGFLPDWLRDKILTDCSNQPGPMLNDWFIGRGVDVGAVVADRAAAARRSGDWSEPARVRASVAQLAGHPMEGPLGRILGIAVARHAPENLGHVPPEFHPVAPQ